MESKLDLVQLRRLAEAATPGPWECREHEGLAAIACPGITWLLDGYETPEQEVMNKRYIAAANPAAILELLDQLEEYKHVAIARIEAACEKSKPGSILPVTEVDQASGMFS